MDSLKDIVYALIRGLSDVGHLSMPRLIKSLYLFDWSCVLNNRCNGQQFQWSCGMCGPFCEQISNDIIEDKKAFRTYLKDNHYGGMKLVVECTDTKYAPQLSETSMKAVEHVIKETKGMQWNDFVRLISSTMPVVMSNLDEPLDLLRAAEFRKQSVKGT